LEYLHEWDSQAYRNDTVILVLVDHRLIYLCIADKPIFLANLFSSRDLELDSIIRQNVIRIALNEQSKYMSKTIQSLLNNSRIDPSWQTTLTSGLTLLDNDYINDLVNTTGWLPGLSNLLNAFSIAKHDVKYILLGESPYPRQQSANGYAFWDSAVHSIWSATGLATPINRATSLRNFIKMLLVADHQLKKEDVSQQAIAQLDKSNFIDTLDELFDHMLDQGFLLLNASLVLSNIPVKKEAKIWLPFIKHILSDVCLSYPQVKLLLFGKIAQNLQSTLDKLECSKLISEHPYNISFINNKLVHDTFSPLQLLKKFAK